APVVGHVAGAVVDEAYLEVAELPRAGGGAAGRAGMHGRREGGPLGGAERQVLELHGSLILDRYGPRSYYAATRRGGFRAVRFAPGAPGPSWSRRGTTGNSANGTER